jgi:polysaccharide pyruvyl transferase WcaK-like protein
MLSHLLALPVLALSYERKITALMSSAGFGNYYFPIGAFDPANVIVARCKLLADRSRLSRSIRHRVEACAERVNRQYNQVFGTGG